MTEVFDNIKNKILDIDPVNWVEKYLNLDNAPFRLRGNGFKPFVDIYRYVGLKAIEKHGKPIVILASRQIGKSTMGAAMELYFMANPAFGTGTNPPMRVMHLFPFNGMAALYTKTKLDPLIASSVQIEDPKNPKLKKPILEMLLARDNNSLSFKQFANGNHLFIDSTGLGGDRLRGRTADVIIFDEIQDMLNEAVGNSVSMLNQSKYGPPTQGVQIYVGTPKKKGSDFYKLWQASSQQYYYLGCEKCKKHFPLYTPESDKWEETWLHGMTVQCTHCKFQQDKIEAVERGKWIGSKDPNDPSCKLIGFHINQLFMPMVSKEDVINQKPGIHPTKTERQFKNEIMGEFYHGDSSPLELSELIEVCGEPERKFTKMFSPGEKEIVVMGIDYRCKI